MSSESARLEEGEKAAIDRRRYRRLRWFFLRIFLHLLWWDLLLNRPGLSWLRREPIPRWQELALRYRLLAVEMGGVLIKLGQYLSTRVDLLPREVTETLKGLQDEVPAETFPAIRKQIEEDFGRPLAEVFPTFEREPLGAASLAQVHAATLPGGEEVVAKVRRPGISVLVETDLAAIGLALGWLKGWSFVRRRVDLDWLVEEFTTTTRRELDFRAEGRHAERFAADFADDPGVRIPKIFWSHTTGRTLIEENVAHIKVGDRETLEAAGIDPAELARRLYGIYMRQIFVHSFVHADPHPGNIFVRPLAGESERVGRPFEVIFIDFGMVAEIPDRLRKALRNFLIGLGSRDAGRVVQACAEGGLLLPGADLAQLEEALETLFDRFWGADVTRLGELVRSEAAALWREFRDLLLETPIQIQVDLTFTGRAFELLSGLATGLDPNFNPWLETMPFAEELARETGGADWSARAREVLAQGQVLAALPLDLARSASLARRGKLVVRTSLAPDLRRQAERMERSIDSLSTTVAAGALLLAGAVLFESSPTAAALLLGAGGLGLLWQALRRWLR